MIEHFEEDGKTLTLRRRGEVVDLLLGNVVLLSSAALETELAFGRLVQTLVPGAKRVLVGGLGFGATARGALESGAHVKVVEKLATVEKLLRGPLAHLSHGVLVDPRIQVVREDVADAIAAERDLDAILLDVDNGPEWASFRTNARLYSPGGLAAAHAALAPGGVYVVWSGYPADAFVPKLRAAGFAPSVVPLKERGVVRARAYVGRRG